MSGFDDLLGAQDDPVRTPALGTVAEQGRGSWPFTLLHGEALVACAAWAMGEAGVHLVDIGTPWTSVVAAGDPFVVHDSLCPMTPPDFLAACVDQAAATDAVVVGVRPLTDTVKQVRAQVVGATVDRDTVWAVVSPVVLPASVVADLGEQGPASLSADLDLAELVGALAQRYRLEHREAPVTAQRVDTEADLDLLAALTAPSSAGPGLSGRAPSASPREEDPRRT